MFLDLALKLSLYIVIWHVLIRYKHVTNKAMSSLDSLLKITDEGCNNDIPEKEGVCRKCETLKDTIQYRKTHLLPGKKGEWSTENIDRKTDEEVEKLYNMYVQWQREVKSEMTGRAMGRHLINLYSNWVRKVLKIDDIEQLCRNINENPITKDSMADIGILMVSTFGKWLLPIVVACHTANHTEGFVNILEEQPETQEKDW